MSVDQVERLERQVNEGKMKERGSMTVETGNELKSMVMKLLDSNLEKGEVEEEMKEFLPGVEEWLVGGEIAQKYNPRSAVIDDIEWESFLRCRNRISFPLERVGGGTRRLCVQRVRENEGRSVMMWLADPGVQDGFGGVDKRFEDEYERILLRDDSVIVERDVRTDHLGFRLKVETE